MQQGISYSGQIVFFQSLHYTCFSSAVCPLQVPGVKYQDSSIGSENLAFLQSIENKRKLHFHT